MDVSAELRLYVSTFEDQRSPGEWRVEAIDMPDDGACYLVIFAGPDAESRAREYAIWKYGAVEVS